MVPLLKRVACIVWNREINSTYVSHFVHVTSLSLSRCGCIGCSLPDPEVKSRREAEVGEVNNKVLVELRRKRPSLHHPDLCTKIGKFAAFSSNKAAVNKYL